MSLEGLLSQLQQLFLTWSKRLPAIDRPWSRFGSLTPWLHIHSENSASWSVLMGRSYKLPIPWTKSQCHAEHFLLHNILWSVSQMNFTSLKLVGSDNGSQRHRSNKSNLIQMNWNNQYLFIRGKKPLPFPLFLFFLPHSSTFIIHISTPPLPQTVNQHSPPLPWGNNLLIYQFIQLSGMKRPQSFIFSVTYRLDYSLHMTTDFASSSTHSVACSTLSYETTVPILSFSFVPLVFWPCSFFSLSSSRYFVKYFYISMTSVTNTLLLILHLNLSWILY